MAKRKTSDRYQRQLIVDEFDLTLPASHHFPELLWDKETWIDLLNCMPAEQLSAGWFPMVSAFYKQNKNKSWGKIDGAKMCRYLTSPARWTKDGKALFAFSVLRNSDIFHELLDFFPPEVHLVFGLLIWNTRMTGHDLDALIREKYPHLTLKDIIERDIFDFTVSKYQRYHAYRQLDLRNTELSLPIPIRRICVNYLDKPRGYYIEPADEIPLTDNVWFFSAESEIFDEMPQLLALNQQGRIKHSVNGKPHLTTVKQAAKRTGIKEFYPGQKNFPVRTHMLIGLLHNFKSGETRVEEVIKVLLDTQFFWEMSHSQRPKTLAPFYVFNHVKGMNAFTEADFDGRFNHYLLTLARELPVGKWVTVENYLSHLEFSMVSACPFSSYALNKLYVEEYDERFGRNMTFKENIVEDGNVQLQVIIPYAFGLVFVLAALGIFEIAYTPVDFTKPFNSRQYSEYDGLKAFRLTELGAYALGLTQDYKPHSKLTESKYFFDPNALLLRVEGELDLLGLILEPFLERITPNRFSFTNSKFLEGCENEDEITEKIERFKSIVQTPLPPLWEKTLRALRDKAESIVFCREWTVHQINAEDKTLQRLLAHDPILKTLVLKAEQFRILVKADDIRRLRTRLRELGYLF